MGFTPYPAADRENPSIVVSSDKLAWDEPTGLVNPIVPVAEVVADGYANNSDPDIVELPDGRLACYYRPIYGASVEGIYRKTSTDLVTWSTREECITSPTGVVGDILSPAVVVEADDSFSMYTVNDKAVSNVDRVERRTSADGVAWGAPTTCKLPSSAKAWHVDVNRIGSRYYMLLAGKDPYRLYALESTDGSTFDGPINILSLSGQAIDSDGFYRSTWHPADDSGHRWHVWVTAINSPDSNVFNAAAVWTVCYAYIET